MLAIEKTVLPSVEQMEIVIEGMRNPLNSWDKSDSRRVFMYGLDDDGSAESEGLLLGEADESLMMKLAKAGSVHAKYRRMIPVWVTVNAPLYWWKEYDTYKIGTVANSCSTMHKITEKEFTLDDFSHERLFAPSLKALNETIERLNGCRDSYIYLKSVGKEDKECWYNLIQLLPSSYNQKRTLFLNYEVLTGIYRDRKNHKLDEWHTFCDWIKCLPWSEFITLEDE